MICGLVYWGMRISGVWDQVWEVGGLIGCCCYMVILFIIFQIKNILLGGWLIYLMLGFIRSEQYEVELLDWYVGIDIVNCFLFYIFICLVYSYCWLLLLNNEESICCQL